MLPDPSKPIEAQEPVTLLAMLVWGESRSEKEPGMLAVAHVVRNRVLAGIYGGTDWNHVMLKPFQFSCFLASDPNRLEMLDPLKHDRPEVWQSCCVAAQKVYDGLDADLTGRATHYYVIGMPAPIWVGHMKHTVDIGKHRFYRDPLAFRILPEEDIGAAQPVSLPPDS